MIPLKITVEEALKYVEISWGRKVTLVAWDTREVDNHTFAVLHYRQGADHRYTVFVDGKARMSEPL